jgi:hypothetical protein
VGQSTAEFDSHVTASLRSYLKAKRLSDAEIDARLKAYANPLDAAKGLLKDDRDSHYLERKIREAGPMDHAASVPLAQIEKAEGKMPADTPSTTNLAAIGAKLKAAGVKVSDKTEADPHHGRTVHKPAAKDGPSPGG